MTQEHTRFIDIPETSHKTSLGKTSIYELVKAKELRPIKLGRKTVFSEKEVNAWIEKQISNRKVA